MVLKAACRRFHAHVEAGIPDTHWRTCAVCTNYVRAVALAHRARIRSPLPRRLTLRLRRIAGQRPALESPLRNPTLPAGLEGRLRRIPTTASLSTPPLNLRSAAPAMAASYLLVLALGLTIGNPYRAGESFVRQIADRTTSAWTEMERRSTGLWFSVTETSTRARDEAELQRRALLTAGERLLDRARNLPSSLALPSAGSGEEPPASADPSTNE